MKLCGYSALLSLLVAGGLFAGDLIPDCSAVDGWSQKGEVRTFEPDNLFDYMNGNAEGYIIYGFQKMTGVTCVSGEESVLIDISEMESPELAYGIFAANRHPRHDVTKLGTAGQIMPRKATFVKGKYYVELAAKADNLTALEALANALEPKIPGTSELPAALSWFPREGLDSSSVRLVPQSVLGLRMLKRGFVASYDDGRAFLVAEDSPESAAAVIAQFRERLSDLADTAIGDEAISGKDRYLGSMCVVRKGLYVIGTVTRKEADLKARAAALTANLP